MFKMKKITAFILAMLIAFSCCAFAETTISARSATLMVTVEKYEITKDQLATAGTTTDDITLAKFDLTLSDQVKNDVVWTVKAGETNITENVDISGTYKDHVELKVSDLKDLATDLVNTFTVTAEAEITTPGGEVQVEKVTLNFTIVNTDNDKNVTDPTNPDPDGDKNNPKDMEKTDNKDEGDSTGSDLSKAAVVVTLVAPKSVKEGDHITATASVQVNADVKKIFGVDEDDVAVTVYASTDGATGTAIGTGTSAVTWNVSDTGAVYGKVYYLWAVGTLEVSNNPVVENKD